MNILFLTYNPLTGSYSYSISKEAPHNCEILDYDDFSNIKLINKFILFIGNAWTGIDIGHANKLAEIAPLYPGLKFYFKLVINEVEMENVIPKEIEDIRLPMILYVNSRKILKVSSGLIDKDELRNKIESLV